MGRDLIKELWSLLAEKFKGNEDLYGITIDPPQAEEMWRITTHLYDYHNIIVAAHADRKVEISGDIGRTRGEIEDMLYHCKYRQRFEKATTEEEKKRIDQELRMETDVIFEDFKQRRFERHLENVAYLAAKYLWAEEVARRMSEKYGFEVKLEGGLRSYFTGFFDSSNMSEEQIIYEVLKRIDAILESRDMYRKEEMMNEFLASKRIGVKRSRRHTKRQ